MLLDQLPLVGVNDLLGRLRQVFVVELHPRLDMRRQLALSFQPAPSFGCPHVLCKQ